MREATAAEVQLIALVYAAYDTWSKWRDHRDLFYPTATQVSIIFEEGQMETVWRDKSTNLLNLGSLDTIEADLRNAAIRQLCHAYEQRLPLLKNTSHTLYFDIEYTRPPVLYVED
jgi:hypothetical protein